MTERDRLYGLTGAEELWFDPADAVQNYIDSRYEDGPLDLTIEEWSVHPPRYHLPTVPTLLEWLDDWVADNGEVGDECEFEHTDAISAAADALLDTIASTIRWRMADTKLRDLHVTGTEDDPLIDGQPVFVPRTTDA